MGPCALAQHVGRSLQVDNQVRGHDVRGQQVVETLVNEQFVVVEIQVRVDFVFVKKVVADSELAEQICLT